MGNARAKQMGATGMNDPRNNEAAAALVKQIEAERNVERLLRRIVPQRQYSKRSLALMTISRTSLQSAIANVAR
jgi:hypothetical protein